VIRLFPLGAGRQLPSFSVCGRRISVSRAPGQEAAKSYKDEVGNKNVEPDEHDEEEQGFGRSKRADQAAQLNLSARLSKEGKTEGKNAGWGEVWRLLKIASPEKRPLFYAFIFLLISSSVSMSVPFSIGKILDIATKS